VSGVGVVVAVAGDVWEGAGPSELWRLDMRGLAVPPAGVLELVVPGSQILLSPRSSAMPPHRRLKRLRRNIVAIRLTRLEYGEETEEQTYGC
jgi:hypothetical protein